MKQVVRIIPARTKRQYKKQTKRLAAALGVLIVKGHYPESMRQHWKPGVTSVLDLWMPEGGVNIAWDWRDAY